MGLENKEVQSSLESDEIFKREVYFCIKYITHKSPLLQDLFSKWASLTARQQTLLNYSSSYILNKKELAIFSSIIKGLHFWNSIQDTEGACGYHKNPLQFRFNTEQEKRIFKVITDINLLIATVNKKAALCAQLRRYSVSYKSNKLVFLQKTNNQS